MKVLAIIPARGGSKGVPRKNIKNIAGKPLLAYAIDCALNSKKITHFAVSTDDQEIAMIAHQYKAPVIMRPTPLANDEAPMLPVLMHALDYSEKEKQLKFDLIVLLQPTSPIRTGQDVDNVVKMFKDDTQLDGVISVVETTMHPARMYNVDAGGWMHTMIDAGEVANRQALAPVYYRNGCIYAVRPQAMIREKNIMVKNKKAYIMPAEWHANIDEEKDFISAERLLKMWKKQQNIPAEL